MLTADYNGGLAELRSQVQAGNGAWDVIDLELQDAVRACDEKPDREDRSEEPEAGPGRHAGHHRLPARHADGLRRRHHHMVETIIAYDERNFPGTKPSTIADFFDLKSFPASAA